MTISFEQIVPFEQTSDGHALDRLLGKLVHETLNAEELEKLEQLLKKSPDARVHYLRHLDLHSSLSAHWGVVDSLALPTKKKSDPKLRRRSSDRDHFRPNVWATAATLAVFALGAIIWQTVLLSKSQSFEVLVNHSEESYIPGQKLSQGMMSIESGDMTFKLASDVTIEASGATTFNLANSMNLHLLGGTVTADAALMKGDGFTVHTSHATITDLGTRFGVKTSTEMETEKYTDVVVFSGKVDIKSKSSQNALVLPAIYAKNQAVRINADTASPPVTPRTTISSPQFLIILA
jgi:ferric-dicitrate binding protein FerR (iron transport regulator)